MAYEQIIAETDGNVGIIRFNRPESLNAWTTTLSGEMTDQINAWNADASIGAIVLTGEGRAFMAGADLNDFSDRVKTNKNADTQGGGQQIQTGTGTSITGQFQRSKPIIAAVNGYAVGIGLTLILPCDIRIASTKALMSIRFVKMGLMPELGSTRILSQLVGLGHATDMSLTGRMVPADEALRMGLVTAVTEPEDLMSTAITKAKEIAGNPPGAVMLIKELLRKNPMEADLEAVMERESIRDQIARRHPDHAEAVAAFLEKRDPKFTNS
ncbi:MAG: enoyl-CoA hydratase [Gammaproteobacteria bacterium]|nr:enoyl-CoA hydratase [Gammaproteobacteria bacterium]RPG23617.1 MAG: enoyl-CoA hydratase/isomerase family protein [Gammaproteobacteria bacterium TMED50]|tara:strand:- start:2878 stop:3684 length:807 start_codon:yes stop_codon:yes gene_type:complete